jgi:hypothetical protein
MPLEPWITQVLAWVGGALFGLAAGLALGRRRSARLRRELAWERRLSGRAVVPVDCGVPGDGEEEPVGADPADAAARRAEAQYLATLHGHGF